MVFDIFGKCVACGKRREKMELKASAEEWGELARGLQEIAVWSLAMGVVALVGVVFGMVIMAQIFLEQGGWR